MKRRTFIKNTGMATAAAVTTAQADWLLPLAEKRSSLPIIDTHIHLFDTTRPQGVPWPTQSDGVLYQPALPQRYRNIAAPLGIKGAIAIEASPWPEDNQWVLDVAAKDKMIVGMIGNLEPGSAGFGRQLESLRQNALFLGIRYGNLWNRDLAAGLSNSAFLDDLGQVAAMGLTLDTANPNIALLAAIVKLTDKLPGLRVVIDHLPQMIPPAEASAQKTYQALMQQLGTRSQVYVKVSEVLRNIQGNIPDTLSFYRDRLDEIFDTFGEDRLLYGSDWPNSDQWLPVQAGLRLVSEYFNAKGKVAAEKYFWKNSVAAYGWQQRDASQPQPERHKRNNEAHAR